MEKWLVEAANICLELSNRGYVIGLSVNHGNVVMEHRDPVSYELICGITVREITNKNAVASLLDYLHATEKEVFGNADNS